jgi:hypothetical protein
MVKKLMLLVLPALLLSTCAPCSKDTDCGSLGLCFRGECRDFSSDQVPCSCMNDVDCKVSRLQCVAGRCVTDLGTPVMCTQAANRSPRP